MTSSGLYRSLAGCGMCLSIGGLRCRTPTIGRQDKSADCGRAHVVGGIKVFGNLSHHHAGACLTKSNDFSGSSAVARIIAHGSRS